jgi:hypothetical protein
MKHVVRRRNPGPHVWPAGEARHERTLRSGHDLAAPRRFDARVTIDDADEQVLAVGGRDLDVAARHDVQTAAATFGDERTRAAAADEHPATEHLHAIDGVQRDPRVFVKLKGAAVGQRDFCAPQRDVDLVARQQHQSDLRGTNRVAVHARDRSIDVRDMPDDRLGLGARLAEAMRRREKQAKTKRQDDAKG